MLILTARSDSSSHPAHLSRLVGVDLRDTVREGALKVSEGVSANARVLAQDLLKAPSEEVTESPSP